jgi:hypothetical protein
VPKVSQVLPARLGPDITGMMESKVQEKLMSFVNLNVFPGVRLGRDRDAPGLVSKGGCGRNASNDMGKTANL